MSADLKAALEIAEEEGQAAAEADNDAGLRQQAEEFFGPLT